VRGRGGWWVDLYALFAHTCIKFGPLATADGDNLFLLLLERKRGWIWDMKSAYLEEKIGMIDKHYLQVSVSRLHKAMFY
jgi:hypothetical protein